MGNVRFQNSEIFDTNGGNGRPLKHGRLDKDREACSIVQHCMDQSSEFANTYTPKTLWRQRIPSLRFIRDMQHYQTRQMKKHARHRPNALRITSVIPLLPQTLS